MNWRNISFDWNQVRAFLAAVEEGSLSAAARALRQTQPTMSRQVAALEEELGVLLFERVGRTLVLTPAGLELLDHVRAMGEAASRISLTASGQSQAVDGIVCITATDIVATYFLPPMLHRLRREAPGVRIEIVASNAMSDLRRREADIAIRHGQPSEPDLIARNLGDTTAHLYAARSYLEEFGRPEKPADLASADFIGFEHSGFLLAYLKERGIPVTKDSFKITSETGAVSWDMVRQGLGIGVMSREIAARTPGIEMVLPDLAPIPIPMWLATHRELHTSRRIRLVFDMLVEEITRINRS